MSNLLRRITRVETKYPAPDKRYVGQCPECRGRVISRVPMLDAHQADYAEVLEVVRRCPACGWRPFHVVICHDKCDCELCEAERAEAGEGPPDAA
jgi:predicted  nucleic acid-binding Zn-ribbon protein